MPYSRAICAQMTGEMADALERIAVEMSAGVIIVRVSDVVRMACAAYIAAQPAGATGREAAAFEATFVKAEAAG